MIWDTVLIGIARTIDLGYCINWNCLELGGLLIAFVRTIDLGYLLIGLARTIDLEGGLLSGIARTIDLGYCLLIGCLLYTSPSPRDLSTSRMPSSA